MLHSFSKATGKRDDRIPFRLHGHKREKTARLVVILPVIRSTDWRFFHELKKALKG